MAQSSLAPTRRERPVGVRRLVGLLPALRAELERQREFRIEQLAHLITHDEHRMPMLGHGPRATD